MPGKAAAKPPTKSGRKPTEETKRKRELGEELGDIAAQELKRRKKSGLITAERRWQASSEALELVKNRFLTR